MSTIRLQRHAAAKAVEHKRLMGLRNAELEGQASVLDTGPTRRTGATVMPSDKDVVGLRLCHTGSDSADANL